MINESLENLIDESVNFNEIYDQIRNQRRGVLHKIIELIIDSSNDYRSQKKQIVEDVCKHFGIKNYSEIQDDFGIAYNNIPKPYLDIIRKFLWIDKIDIFGILKQLEMPAFIKFCSMLEDKQKMRILVFTAFVLIAGVAFVKWKSSTPNQSPKSYRKQLLNRRRTPVIDQSIPTAICLVVPASEAYKLSLEKSIYRDEIIELIAAASDFLCIQQTEASQLSVEIDPDQTPSPDSKLKFYLRIDIPDGKAIINEKTKYVIKRDLPPNTQGKIKELGRLTNISSISSFNRI